MQPLKSYPFPWHACTQLRSNLPRRPKRYVPPANGLPFWMQRDELFLPSLVRDRRHKYILPKKRTNSNLILPSVFTGICTQLLPKRSGWITSSSQGVATCLQKLAVCFDTHNGSLSRGNTADSLIPNNVHSTSTSCEHSERNAINGSASLLSCIFFSVCQDVAHSYSFYNETRTCVAIELGSPFFRLPS